MPEGVPPSWLHVEEIGCATVVRFTASDIPDDEAVDLIGEELGGLMDRSPTPLVAVDFSGVTFCDSALLGKLLTLRRRASAAGGWLAVCLVAPDVFEALDETSITPLVPIYLDREGALLALQR